MRAALVGAVLLVAAVTWLGSTTSVRTPAPATVALGPDQGATAQGYLDRAAAGLAALDPADAGPRWALVPLAAGTTAAALAPALADVRVSRVLLHVAVPDVQTAVVAVDVAGQGAAADVLRGAQESAAATQQAAAAVLGRVGQVAALSAARLRAGCACVVGLLVRADGAALRALAAAPGVRGVDVAPAGTSWGSLAVRPLLPEQAGVVGPGRDDGAVPAG